ncbi:MAG: CHAT domain-containing protein [Saprospiraceae bacterium]|nr:CHAT domain-containing protein [Saprospiraceae bacterium]
MTNLGSIYEQKGEYEQAIELLQKAVSITQKVNSPDLGAAYNNLGLSYLGLGNCDQAVFYYKKSIAFLEKNQPDGAGRLAEGYIGLGDSYSCKGDFNLAIEAVENSIAILVKKFGENTPYLVYAYHSLGNIYSAAKDYKKAIVFKEKELQLWIAQVGETSGEVGFAYQGIGTFYKNTGNYDLAISFYEKTKNNWINKPGYEEELGVCYNGIGFCYEMKKDYEQAMDYYGKAQQLFSAHLPAKHHHHVDVNNYMGNCQLAQSNYAEALAYFQKALEANNYYGDITQVIDIPRFIKTLDKMGVAQRLSRAPDALLSSSASYAAAREAIRYQRTRLISGKKELATAAAPVFEGSVQTNFLLYQQTNDPQYIEDAFACMEESRAVSLLEFLQDAGAIYSGIIPDSILGQERSLNMQLAQYEKQRFQALNDENKSLTDTALLDITQKLYETRTAYNTLKKDLESNYPDYFRQKYDLSIASLVEVRQQVLRPDQTLLEYMVSDSAVFIFVINKSEHKLIRAPHDGRIDSLVNDVRAGLYRYYELPASKRSESAYISSLQQYVAAAQELYDKLIAPVKSHLTSSVVVIADPRLAMLPFEVLLSAPPRDLANFSTYPFLVRQYQFSYCYSATLLREMTQKEHRKPAANGLLAFAPFYTQSKSELAQLAPKDDWLNDPETMANRKGWKELPHSGPEVYYAARRWNGAYFVGPEASKSAFLSQADQYKILHLSTHGAVDSRSGDYSYLAFSATPGSGDDSRLYVREIYTLALNADLVILSACETAVGELQKGEGIINLSRAFASAGAKSIVTSLWVVNDAASEKLMGYFHEQLRAGKPKDEAMQQAKLRYMQQQPGEKSHPFFWAGFVGVGDVGRIKQ